MRHTRLAAACAAVVAALVLAGCSGSEGTLPDRPAPITGNGQHYAYDESVVAKSQWPSPCALLSTASAAAALETTVSRHRFHNNCYYVPAASAFPTLTITLLAVGNQLSDEYEATRDSNSVHHPQDLDGVGNEASIYQISSQAERRLDVLAGNALFELTLKNPIGRPVNSTRARATLIGVGQAVAGEFRS